MVEVLAILFGFIVYFLFFAKKSQDVAMAGMVCILAMLLMGCKRDIVVQSSTIEIKTRDTLFFTKESNVEKTIYIDTLKQEKWYYYFDSLHKAELAYMRDKLGRVNFKARCPPDTIRATNTVIRQTIQQASPPIEIKYIPFWIWVLIGILSVLPVVVLIWRK